MNITLEQMDEFLAMNAIHISIENLHHVIDGYRDCVPESLREELHTLSKSMDNFNFHLTRTFMKAKDKIKKGEEEDE